MLAFIEKERRKPAGYPPYVWVLSGRMPVKAKVSLASLVRPEGEPVGVSLPAMLGPLYHHAGEISLDLHLLLHVSKPLHQHGHCFGAVLAMAYRCGAHSFN